MTQYAGQYGPNGVEYPDGTHAVNRPVAVYLPDGVTLATLYTDKNRTAVAANPTSTDNLANLTFWVNPGNYICVIEGTSIYVQVSKDPLETVESVEASSIWTKQIVNQATSADRVVTISSSGKAIYADPTNFIHANRPMWLTTAAWAINSQADLLVRGVTTEPTWNWTLGIPIFLGINGVLTQIIPGGISFLLKVGVPIDAHTIDFNPTVPIIKG